MPSDDLARVCFGSTDLQVSRLCQGTAFRSMPREEQPRGVQVLEHCLEVGVNFFDSAIAYGWGGAESCLGRAIAGRRDQAVICTKVPSSQPPPEVGGSGVTEAYTGAYLTDQLEGSLRRLGTDYVDLFLLHHTEKGGTPPAVVAAAMDELVRSGKTRYWGVSNHSGNEVQEYVDAAAAVGTAPPVGTEDYYNIAGNQLMDSGKSRTAWLERDLFPVTRKAGLGLIAFSPVDCGALAPGKEGDAGPALKALIQTIDGVAGDLGLARATVCVAWVLTHPEVTSVLAGSESEEHVDQNLAGTTLELPSDALSTLNGASVEFRRRREEQGG